MAALKCPICLRMGRTLLTLTKEDMEDHIRYEHHMPAGLMNEKEVIRIDGKGGSRNR